MCLTAVLETLWVYYTFTLVNDLGRESNSAGKSYTKAKVGSYLPAKSISVTFHHLEGRSDTILYGAPRP
jgi:hypothetical protein